MTVNTCSRCRGWVRVCCSSNQGGIRMRRAGRAERRRTPRGRNDAEDILPRSVVVISTNSYYVSNNINNTCGREFSRPGTVNAPFIRLRPCGILSPAVDRDERGPYAREGTRKDTVFGDNETATLRRRACRDCRIRATAFLLCLHPRLSP